ncbi:UNVERIFIED_CONTAM: hypothetical protein GTU68_046889 [Idotea baltica]|nr:hypothetical protein [Idotea baltica]
MVGDIGRIKANLRWCILGSYSIFPLTFINFDLINWCCVSSSLLLEWKGKEWRRAPPVRRALWRRLLYLWMGWGLFCSLWVSYIYFNGEISYKDGEKARMKDAIHNFFKSPMFLEFKKNLRRLYDDAREHGWLHAWKNLVELLDPLGEFHALKVLGLPNGASQEDISARFKNLTKEWHPDRHKTPESKLFAQEKFVEIAQSYEKLSSLKQRRSKKNKRSEDEL